MTSILRRMTNSIPLAGDFRADFYDTNSVQVFRGDRHIATLNAMDETLVAEGIVDALLEGCMQLYSAPCTTAKEPMGSRGPKPLVLDYIEHRNGVATRALLSSTVLTEGEKFAAVVSAQQSNVYAEEDGSEILALAEKGWRLTDFSADSIPWRGSYRAWLLPEMQAYRAGWTNFDPEQLPRFASPEAYSLSLRLKSFLASSDERPLSELLASGELAAVSPRLELSEKLALRLQNCSAALNEKVLATMTPAEGRRFYTYFATPSTLPLMAFQVKRFREGVRPVGETHPYTRETSELVQRMPEASFILTHDELKNLEPKFETTVLKHFTTGYGSLAGARAALLAMVTLVGVERTDDLVVALTGSHPWALNRFPELIRKAPDLREFLKLGEFDYSTTPVSWAVAMSPFSS